MNRLTTPIIKFAALVVALAAVGAGTATAAKLITGKQIKNRSVTGTDIKKASLGPAVLTDAAKATLQGAQGAKGDKGDTGAQGERGPSTAYAKHTTDGKAIIEASAGVLDTVSLPAGSYVLQAKGVVINPTADLSSFNCEIGSLSGNTFTQIDQVDGINITKFNTDTDATSFALMGAATLTGGATEVQLRCAPGANQAINVRDRTLIATQVAELK